MSLRDRPADFLAELAAEGNPYFTPAALLDGLERTCHRAISDEAFSNEGAADWRDGEIDVMLSIIIPQLRKALREAGLDVPACGPHSAEWLGEECGATPAAAGAARETALYRWWDDADVLLYIGIADRIGNRTKDHAKGSSWMDFAARSAVERFPSRIVALRAEEAAIKDEHPIFNKQHNDTPEARRRLVEYLIKHDRLDLLAPAVSRG